MPKRLPTFPRMPVTEPEESLRQRFIADIEADYGKLNSSDRHLLELASWEYLKVYRMYGVELQPDAPLMSSMRHHPTRTLLSLLDAMAATRAARLKDSKQAGNDSEYEAQLKSILMGMSKQPVKPPARRAWIAEPEQVQEASE